MGPVLFGPCLASSFWQPVSLPTRQGRRLRATGVISWSEDARLVTTRFCSPLSAQLPPDGGSEVTEMLLGTKAGR